MIWVAMVLSMVALGIAVWLGWEVAELKQRWARLYGLRAAMVETEAALQELMDELDKSGQALLEELDIRVHSARLLDQASAADGGGSKPSAAITDTQEKRVAVIGLSQRGYTVEEIARELGIPRGEVQLVLDLERLRQ
ncbi:MAG: DUF2802 domain-containing protein [Firmicutes bacterium]|jgi:DNA-binding NarL/FixJ family response regulator|nr:DUF2802 domain-containing protein [Bacillota bacterium]